MGTGATAPRRQPPWLAAIPGGIGALTAWTASDGSQRLASSGTDGTIRIWDLERGTAVCAPLVGHTASVWELMVWAWAGGRMLVSTGEDGTIRTWDADTGTPISGPIDAHDGWIRAIAMWNGRAGQPRLASAGTDGVVRIWDPVAGTPVGEPLVRGTESLAALACWSGTGGTRLAIGGDNGRIRVWDVQTRVPVGERTFDHGPGLWVLVTWTAADGGSRLASAGQDGTIRIWNPDAGTPVVGPLRGHTGWVPALATWTTPDGSTRLVSASTDGTIRMWNPETGASVGTQLPVSSGQIATLTTWIGSDGSRRLAFVGEGGTIRIYDADTGTVVGDPLTGHTAGIWALTSWSRTDDVRLAASGDDGIIRLWDADTGISVGRPLVGHTAGVWALVTWRTSEGRSRLASTGDDGTIRVWDLDSYAPAGEPLTGHAGWVPALAMWRRRDRGVGLVSGGVDGTVRRWDPATGRAIGKPLTAHDGWVMSVTTWQGVTGARIASGGVDGTVRVWDADTGELVGAPLRGHTGWVRSLASWTGPDGRTLLVSGGYDGIIRIWDPEAGTAIAGPLRGHVGRVGALAAWTRRDGTGGLASAGADGAIHLWDLSTAKAIGEPIEGHEGGGVWALTLWSDPQSGVRLASAGYDGTVRLWDPETRQSVRAIEVGPIAMWGVSDAPTKRDVIGRQRLAQAIADQLCWHGDESLRGNPGPTVVSVEGPWGCGKTTLMYLIRQALPAPPPPTRRRRPVRHLSVRDVFRQIRRYAGGSPERLRADDAPRAVVTAWFNPWGHQSGDQVWAGLANEIIEAAAKVLYPTEPERERYWFVRNLGRVDRHALLNELRRRMVSPILGAAIAAVVAAFTIASIKPVEVVGHAATPEVVGVIVAVASFLTGAAHTAYRYRWGRAVHYLPSGLFTGPVSDGVKIGDNPPDSPMDPLRRARAGSLYLYQHNIGDIVDDLAARGCDLAVFVDDIDRCRADTTAEVFEAINLFLSNVASRSGLRARFIVGLDSSVVASHLDSLYRNQHDARVIPHGDDPTPGWAFLRKLIHLPVMVPQVPDEGLERFVDAVTRRGPSAPAAPSVTAPSSSSAQVGVAAPAQSTDPDPAVPRQRRPELTGEATSPRPGPPAGAFTRRSVEQHPEVRELVIRRLAAQPDRSMREGKRLLNVWQLYARILDVTEPLTDPAAAVVRARRLLIVAEIVTRWPALQQPLNGSIDHRRGLQLLAAAAEDDGAWAMTVERLGIDPAENERALVNLRDLLREYDGTAVADLASRLT